MINIALKSGDTEGKPLWTKEGQESLSQLFLTIAMVCVPWMLIPKPLILKWQNESKGGSHGEKKVVEAKEVDEMGQPLLQSKVRVG